MAFKNYCNSLLRRHKDPCFLAEIQTHKVVYLNSAMEALLSNYENVIGQKFYHVIKNESPIIDENFVFDWDNSNIHKHKVVDRNLGQSFLVSHIKTELADRNFIIVCYEPDDCEYEQENTVYNFEITMSKCITALKKSPKEKTNTLLKILGEYYDADKTYLYKIDRIKSKILCEASWCKDDSITFSKDLSEIFPIDKILDWYENRNEVGILEASKRLSTYIEGSIEYDILHRFNVEDIAQCIFSNLNNEPIGLIAISNRHNTKGDLRLLQAIGNFLEKDITKNEMKYTVQQINDIDLLTGFYSRAAYSQEIDKLQSDPPKNAGVVFTNVNGLKAINTEFGYAKGDSYIKKVSTYLQDYFKNNFYRTSGDEFVCFLKDIKKEDFDEQLKNLQDQMKKDENSSFAIGYAYGAGTVDINALLEEADTVMYINKQEYYHTSNRSFKDITDTTLSDLLSHLENEEFMIYLQPQVLLKDGSLYGAEALIRRFDKTNNRMVFPDHFISLYEKKSVIRHVDIFVVGEVCKLLAKLGKTNQAIPISVNLSRVTLQEYGIVDTIAKICDKYEVERQYLVIEVTERVGLIENNLASSLIKDFKSQGFKISLDDFGCAYSNIVTLAQIEVDEVKLDKSLVDDLIKSKKNYILVKNVLSMCNELEGTSTLAEGIEDEEQAKTLHDLGCHLGQGYFYSRPIPIEEFLQKYI